MRIDRFAAATLVLACAACSVGPEPRRPDTAVPGGWSADASRAFDATLSSHAVAGSFDGRRWWSVFDDAELNRLVDRALAQSFDVQTASLRIAAARAQRDAAAGAALPTVEGSGIAGRTRMSENGIGKALAGGGSSSGSGSDSGSTAASGGGASSFNLFQAGFDATWELDLFGKTRRNVQASEADVHSAEEARRDAVVSLVAEVVRNWLDLRGALRQREIAGADIDSQDHLAALVASRRRAGLVGTSDVAAQNAQLADARAQLPPIEQQIALAKNRIAQLLAEPPGAIAELRNEPATLPPLPPQVPVGLPGELLRRRPDIRQREADLEAATARIGVAKASLFPSIRFGLTGGLQSTESSSLFDWASRFFIGGAQLSIPIFEGGRLKAQVRIADIQAQEAVLSYRQTVLGAFHDVDNALVAYAAEQRRTAELTGQVDAARRSRALALERYRRGLAAYTDVLDADRRSHQAELTLAQSTVAASTDLVALFKALGGGWSDDDAVAAAR